MGAAVAMVKCGHRGLYIRTADKDRLMKMGAAGCSDVENWANRGLGSRCTRKRSLWVRLVRAIRPLQDSFLHLFSETASNPA